MRYAMNKPKTASSKRGMSRFPQPDYALTDIEDLQIYDLLKLLRIYK